MQYLTKLGVGAVASCLLFLSFADSVMAKTLEIDLPPPGDFIGPIDNKYLPLIVGTSFAYRAETEDGCEFNKLTVTNEIMPLLIDGVPYTAQIIRDQEWEAEDCDPANAEMAEDTKDYHAQDQVTKDVWYLGEETYALPDEGVVCDAEGSWEAGQPPADDPAGDPAVPGVVMLGNPSSGDRYPQEFLEEEAEDWGGVMRLNAKVSIEFDDYVDCLMTREWTPLEPGHIENKFYCPFEGLNPGPGGLMFIEELKEKNVYVEYVGSDFGFTLPGEDDPTFPSSELDCTP